MDAFNRFWQWANKPPESPLTIPAELHRAVMELAPENRPDRDRGKSGRSGDEAVAAAKKALSQNQTYRAAYRCLAAALAHLGRDAEARKAVAQLLEIDFSNI
jgi:hypothetical protein